LKIVFVRHGQDDERYRGGWSDLDLTPEGIEQANKLADHLKENQQEYNISSLVSSDLTRAMTTAKLVSERLDLPIRKECRIREINNGDLAGMRNDEALEKYPGLFFRSLKMDEAYPNGESPNDFCLRIKTWFTEFLSEFCNAKGNALVVTHGGVINVIYHLTKGIAWNNNGSVFPAEPCSIHVLDTEAMRFDIENRTDFLHK